MITVATITAITARITVTILIAMGQPTGRVVTARKGIVMTI
jgi:hypothetical protein